MPFLPRTIAIAVIGHVTDVHSVSHKVVNVFAYFTEDVLGAGTVNLFRTAFNANIWSNIAPLLHEDYIADSYRVYFPAFINPAVGTVTSQSNDGAATGDRCPLSLAVNFVLKTDVRGRPYVGLKRFGPLAESDVDGDELSAAGVTNWSPVSGLLTSTFVDGFSHTWQPIVLSRKNSVNPPPFFVGDGAVITSAPLNLTLGFARHRRLRGDY